MKKGIVLPLLCLALFTFGCNSENASNKTAEEQNENKFDSTDREGDADFAMKAASGGLMEVELGNYAAANASSAKVKAFGQSMATDHQKANDELKALAASKNITLPTMPDNDKQKMIDDLKKKTGADFDKAYIDMMVDDHKEDVDHFQKEADNGKDADIKAWAAGKVPTLQHHLQMAEETQKAVTK